MFQAHGSLFTRTNHARQCIDSTKMMTDMAYERLKPIPGVPSDETTAVTMKTTKELIAEQEAEQAAVAAKAEQAAKAAEAAKARAAALRAAEADAAQPCASDAPRTGEAPRVQQPPHFHDQVSGSRHQVRETQAAPAKPSKSLFGRIFGK